MTSSDVFLVKHTIILSIVFSSIDFKLELRLGGECGCDSMTIWDLSELLVVDFEGGL